MRHRTSEELLHEIKRRILSVSDPERIIVFGSHARGNAGPDSDVDVLVLESHVARPRQESVRLRSALRGLLVPVDVVVAAADQVERYKDSVGMIYGSILRDGKTIYERPPAS